MTTTNANAAADRLRAFTAGWSPPERAIVEEVIAEIAATAENAENAEKQTEQKEQGKDAEGVAQRA